MKKLTKLSAFLNLENQIFKVGELIDKDSKIFFKYDVKFLKTNLSISPFKLAPTNDIVVPVENHFDGLFGVFSDSLPDCWGKLLMDRHFKSKGYNLSSISVLQRLAMLQPSSIGALFYVPTDYNCIENKELNLDAIANEISDVLKGENIDVLDDLFLFGGSSGGARPKILVGYNPKTDQILSDITDLPMDFENWIIKFSSSYDLPDIALIEFTYNQMAVAAGLEVAPFKIFETKKGNRFFGTKRFDRVGNSKLHLHSAAGLMHDNFRLSTMDYGNLMDCAFRLEKNYNAYIKTFRIAVFNVLAHNRDDHSKNFSFLMDAKGLWKLAPAYDLTFSQSSYGHHSTSVNGENKNPTAKHLLDLANHFGLNDAKYIIEEVSNAINNFENLASNNGITKSSKQLISGLIGKKDMFLS